VIIVTENGIFPLSRRYARISESKVEEALMVVPPESRWCKQKGGEPEPATLKQSHLVRTAL
jgi:putative hemolysin